MKVCLRFFICFILSKEQLLCMGLFEMSLRRTNFKDKYSRWAHGGIFSLAYKTAVYCVSVLLYQRGNYCRGYRYVLNVS